MRQELESLPVLRSLDDLQPRVVDRAEVADPID
jgi:hypothetical protein